MARGEDWEFGGDDFFETPDPPDYRDILYGTGDPQDMDTLAQEMMWEAVVNEDDQAYQDLVDYMWDEYGIDIEDVWDWEDFADWYNSQ